MLGTSLQKRLRMEVLEEKVPLASDLTVELVNGDLIITGDDNAVAVGVGMFIENGDKFYRILTQDVDDTITFNGGLVIDDTPLDGPSLLVTGVTRDIRINLGGGDDTLYMLGEYTIVGDDAIVETYVPRDLVINLGDGEDFASVGVPNNIVESQHLSPAGPVGIGRDLLFAGGQGNDTMIASGANIGDDLSVTDTQGDNFVDIFSKFVFQNPEDPDAYPLFDTVVADNISMTTGSGADVVSITTVVVDGNVTVNSGGGEDGVFMNALSIDGSVLVNAGAGPNEVRVEEGTVGGGVLVTGGGANNFQIQNLNVVSSIVLLGSNADDQFFVFNSSAGSAIVTAGGGADTVYMADSAFDLLMVNLGAGNDTLTLDGISASLAILIGGGGSDTLQESADNNFLLAIDLGFETFEEI